jgi:hypothetical protein
MESGITKFCAETGLTCEQLLVLAEGRSPIVEGVRGLLHDDAPADRGCEAGTLRMLRHAWQGRAE